jgi:hypothetical protein
MMVLAGTNAPAGARSVEDGRLLRALHPDRKSEPGYAKNIAAMQCRKKLNSKGFLRPQASLGRAFSFNQSNNAPAVNTAGKTNSFTAFQPNFSST